MSIEMKNKFTATALAIATTLGMGYSSLATAGVGDTDAVQFTTEITVNSVNTCEYTTAPGVDGVNWNLIWKLDEAGEAAGKGELNYNGAVTAPLEVRVNVNAGAALTCKLNNVSIAADMGASVIAGAGSAAYKVGTSDGFWRYMPVVANVELFTDNNFTTQATGDVTVAAADAKAYTVTPQGGVTHTGQTAITPDAAFNWGVNDAVVLSDGYLSGSGYAPLTFNGTTPAVQFAKDAAAGDIHSLVIGISSIIATDPEKDDGTVYVDAVHNTENVSMPFTVNVTYN